MTEITRSKQLGCDQSQFKVDFGQHDVIDLLALSHSGAIPCLAARGGAFIKLNASTCQTHASRNGLSGTRFTRTTRLRATQVKPSSAAARNARSNAPLEIPSIGLGLLRTVTPWRRM